MKNLVLLTALAFAVSAGAAQADIIGKVYTFPGCPQDSTCNPGSGADPGNAIDAGANGVNSGGVLSVTFTLPTTAINMTSDANYSIADFINSNVGGATINTGSGTGVNSLNDTLFVFTGTVTVTNGQQYTAGHDDGLTLVIGTDTVISAPGPTGFTPTVGTYTGPSGTFAFTLTYGECCSPPADLTVSGLTLQTLSVPGPIVGAGLPGLISACGGLMALALRRRRKSA